MTGITAGRKRKPKASRLKVRSKLWLEVDGEPVFSKGRELLFDAIESEGSINRAAARMGIPYRRAWGYIRAMEERLGVTLVETRKGGAHGGGAVLTEDARELLERFRRLEEGIDDLVDSRFEGGFKDW